MDHYKGLTIVRTRRELRTWRDALRREGRTLAFIPTMGALHDGHLSLVRLGLQRADVAAASIFVNPTQFAAHEDFGSYPRDEARDIEMLHSAGCTLAYCPQPADIYPPGDRTRVLVKDISHILEGVPRPHFFEGVATVVSRLFLHVAPDIAVFGEKDYQQLQIIRRMTLDLGFPVEIVGGPTEREADGLAMSSRNVYLSADERARAGALFQVMTQCAALLAQGEPVAGVLDAGRSRILAAGFASIDYLELRNADSLDALPTDQLPPDVPARLLAAARMGRTRLIDNLPVQRG
jgi:pantoate--beta-alanine ligase